MTSLDGVKTEVYGLEGDGFDGARLCALTLSRERTKIYIDGRFLCLFSGGVCSFLGGLELAVDGYVGILVEAGIRLHTGFGLFAAFEDFEIVVQEAEMPLKAGTGCVVFEGVGLALGFFDQFAVGYAGCRPSLGEMVGVELEDFVLARVAAYDDVFATFIAVFEVVHGTAEVFDAHGGLEVAYSTGVERRNLGRRDEMVDGLIQTENCACF